MSEPTRDHITAALARAKHLIDTNHFDLVQALAEATTTEQCQGVPGYKVFRDSRAAVEALLDGPCQEFTGNPSKLLGGML